MLISELAAELKAKGQSMHDYLSELYRQHGLHREDLINVLMEGSEGMAAMKSLMKAFRENPPRSLGGMTVGHVRVYETQTRRTLGGSPVVDRLEGPKGNMIILDMMDEGNYVAVRPSGTEPKVKFYIFTRLNPVDSQDLDAADTTLVDRIAAMEEDVRDFARISV
jgi:phosphoglucomutase/phosphomannomutase